MNPLRSLAVAAILTTYAGTAHAQLVSNAGVLTGLSTMPGSGDDYVYFGDTTYGGNTALGAGTAEPSNLVNFTASAGPDAALGYVEGGNASRNSTINIPGTSTPALTGDLFGTDGNNKLYNVVDFTLSGSLNLDYSSFNAYLMFANYPTLEGGFSDTALTLTLVSSTGAMISRSVESVTDASQGLSAADFAVFNVTGASQGDVLQVGFLGNAAGNYGSIGGVSFGPPTVIPEPSTYAMMLAGFIALSFALRRKSAYVQG